jgi:hypothetical protein
MRHRLFSVLLLALAACLACVSAPDETSVADLSSAPTAETAAYFKTMKLPVAYREVIVSRRAAPEVLTLSPAQAKEDVDMLKYLLDTAYSGRDYWEMRGVDFDGMYKNLYAFVEERAAGQENGRPITNWDLEDRIASLVTPILDNHFGVTGRAPHFTNRHDTAYFADILIEKRGNEYEVADSGAEGVKRGARYTGPIDSLFRTLAPTGRDHFLAGALSYTRITRLALSFDGSPVTVPVHTCRIGRIAYQNAHDFIEEDVDGVPVLSVCSFGGRAPESMRQFINAGSDEKLRRAPRIMLDLRENCGGARAYAEKFLSNLYQVPEFEAREIRQLSPPIVASTLADAQFNGVAANLEDNTPAVFRLLDQKYRKTPFIERALFGREPDAGGIFRGEIIYLIDRRTGSAAEIATSYSRAAKNNVIVGENSAGAMAFGNVRYYLLKNSRIVLSLPSSILLLPGFRETEGFRPDYWLDSDHPEREVARWLRDPEHYRFSVQQR